MVQSSLTHRGESEKREWERYAAQRDVSLPLTCGGTTQLCLVHDISLGGARLVCPEGLPDDEAIVVAHPDIGPVGVERRWARQRECGVTFDFSDNALALVSHCLNAMLVLSPKSARAKTVVDEAVPAAMAS